MAFCVLSVGKERGGGTAEMVGRGGLKQGGGEGQRKKEKNYSSPSPPHLKSFQKGVCNLKFIDPTGGKRCTGTEIYLSLLMNK